jgi:hypothetical protein
MAVSVFNLWRVAGLGESTCGAYGGPALGWNVTECRAPDGSYWALQAWQWSTEAAQRTVKATQAPRQ